MIIIYILLSISDQSGRVENYFFPRHAVRFECLSGSEMVLEIKMVVDA
jgi:hypothetical protein